MIKKQLIFLLLIFFSLMPIRALNNTDSIFSNAINEVKNSNYSNAIQIAKKAYKSDSNRGDILVFIANTYSWDNKNDSALIYIQKAKNLGYYKDDFFESWTNILLRAKEYRKLLSACDEAENVKYSNAENLLQKRLLAYLNLNEYNKGIRIAELAENSDFIKNDPIESIYSSLLLKNKTNLIAANYTLDLFDNHYAPQHLAALGYSVKINENNLTLRINYANRFGKNDVQLESDYYHQLGNKHYMYFNYGYAFNAILFPRHRTGIEYYFPLGATTEGSIGGRFLKYSTDKVYIITGHLGQYFANNWIAIRPFFVLKSNKQSLSFIANYRYYGKKNQNYWGLELGFGNSPDDFYSTTALGTFNDLYAYKIKVEKNFMLSNVSDIKLGLGYSHEELPLNNLRNRYTFDIGYKFRF